MLAPESFTEICGWVVKAAPDAVPTDARETDNDTAAPALTVIDCVAATSDPEENVTV